MEFSFWFCKALGSKEDVITKEGMQFIETTLVSLDEGACVWLDPSLDSWCCMSADWSKRATRKPHGDTQHPKVVTGNTLVKNVVDIMSRALDLKLDMVVATQASAAKQET